MGVVVVGDLHLSSGFDPARGGWDRHECFRVDDAFGRFLEHVGGAGTRVLVILGDLIDFLNVTTDTGTSAAAAGAKLERVAAGHPSAFRALGVLATECPISIVLGNHDVELAHRSVQERFRELVVRASGRAEAGARIRFHPWVYYEPGVLYAEHGSQYHDLNAFPSVVAPASRDSIDLPLGSHLTRYVIELAESFDPGGTMRADPRVLLAACRARPALVVRPLRAHARFLRAVVGHALRSPRPRRAERERVLRVYADEAGLSVETLTALDDLAALSPLAVARRALRTLATRPAPGATEQLRRAAFAVHAVLEEAGAGVPVYAFGHTHRADQVRLSDDGRHCYVNCGTWSSLLPRSLEPLGDAVRFTFVEVDGAGDPGRPTARLLRWNDQAGRAEQYVPPAA